MIVTHVFSIFSWIGFVLLIIFPMMIHFDKYLPAGDFVLYAAFALWIAFCSVIAWVVLFPLSTWLYVFIFRKTVLTFKEAKEFTPVFFINKSGRWYPMKELNEIPPSERPAYLRNFIKQNNLAYRSFSKPRE